MPADTPRFDDTPVPTDTPDTDSEDKVDVVALEQEAAELEKKELEEAERRVAELCRAVQRGKVVKDFLEENELDPGHTLEHVAKTDTYLQERGKRSASTFTDLRGAERAIAHVLRARSDDIDEWLGGPPADTEAFAYDVGWPAGRVAGRGGDIRTSSVVRVVLLPSTHGYRILTAYLL